MQGLLGSERCERGVQETLTDEKKLEIIRGKFAPSVLFYNDKGTCLGRAEKQPDGTFLFNVTGYTKVYFWAFEADRVVRPLGHPLVVVPGDTIHLHGTVFDQQKHASDD